MKRLPLLFGLAISLCAPSAWAERKIQAAFPVVVPSLIDTPTAEVLDYGSFSFNNRFFANGGLTPSISFGVFQRLMFGASMELDNYVGSGDVDAQRPELQIKFRFFDGRGAIPAMALGYDSQGHRYYKPGRGYLLEERGLFLALSREFLLRGLELTSGANVSDFEKDSLRGFGSLSYAIEDAAGVFFEYDNVRTSGSRANAGVNLFLSPFVQMGFAVRDLFGDKMFPGTALQRKPERIIDIRYVTSF